MAVKALWHYPKLRRLEIASSDLGDPESFLSSLFEARVHRVHRFEHFLCFLAWCRSEPRSVDVVSILRRGDFFVSSKGVSESFRPSGTSSSWKTCT